jgi:hypothetical protein
MYALSFVRVNGTFGWWASFFYENWFVHVKASDLTFEI